MPSLLLRLCRRGLLLSLMAALLALTGIWSSSRDRYASPGRRKNEGQARPGRTRLDETPCHRYARTRHDIYALGDIHGDYERASLSSPPPRSSPATPASRRRSLDGRQGGPGLHGRHHRQGRSIAAGHRSAQGVKAVSAWAGGRVIVTLGNHEAAFLAHPTHDKKAWEFVKG